MVYTHREKHRPVSGQEALELLKAGNRRFIQNLKINRSLQDQVLETAFEQQPFAAILSCMDSNAVPELIFDLGLGDILSLRVAGAAVNEEVAESIELGVAAGAALIVVLGHSNCRAIYQASGEGLAGAGLLSQRLKPAIKMARQVRPQLSQWDFINAIACHHVKNSLHALLDKSAMLKRQVLAGSVKLVGGMYDSATGHVQFVEREITDLLPFKTERMVITSDVLVK